MRNSIRPGDVVAGRYRMVDLLSETEGGLFWRARDQVLARHVAFHVIDASDFRASLLLEAAKRSATVTDPRILRVLDADEGDDLCYVVNEWGSGKSLDILLADGPLSPRRAAWIVSEVAETIARAHALGQAHGRLVPENVLIDHNGSVKIIGFAVDAALHGLPTGRRSTDVVDLAGLLYASLVGKWPGVSRSALPPAPQAGGQPLRPRKVRAGIPKALDTICDEVLSPFAPTGGSHPRGIDSAAGIHDALLAFVGDPGALAAAEATRAPGAPAPGSGAGSGPELVETAAMYAVPGDPAGTDPSASTETTETTETTGSTETTDSTETSGSTDSADFGATVAGSPLLDDSWLEKRTDAPPPPAFEQPPERPLYAPDPVRRPRRPADGGNGNSGEYWPWDTSTGSGTGTGSGAIPRAGDDEGPVPGRSWLRLAAGLAAAILLLTAVVFAFDLGRDTADPGTDEPTESSSPTGQVSTVLTVSAVDDYDPQGDPPEENGDEAPNVIDGDPSTTWTTMTYEQNFGPGGLKDGVGLLLDLGGTQEVGQVEVDFVGAPTTAQLFLYDAPPSGVPTGEPTAEGTADQTTLTLSLDQGISGRYLLVWLTSLPNPGDFRAEISEITVRS